MSSAPLYGLVLAGGRGTRMGRDKASLEYAGKPQLVRAMELLAPLVSRAFVSVRLEQAQKSDQHAYPTIADLTPDLGPLGGIQAALATHPANAWLILACDLPFLGADTLEYLLLHRASARLATAFRSRSDGLPEPLCAIYEPASRDAIEAWIKAGERCPRAWMRRSDVALLELPDARALDNVNTNAQYAAASAALRERRRLNVRYFALLREQAGRNAEMVESAARTPQELYEELRAQRGLQLAPESLRVAVNDEFGEWSQPLVEGDTVVFLPPVAGG
jgi:molybdopterin-guanine dinucleotide biosynthesis protein A